jgi:hypothetical protein
LVCHTWNGSTPYIQKGKQWDNVLPAITFAINASVNSSTKYSPFEVVFGSRPNFPLHQHHTDFYTIVYCGEYV